MQHSSDTQSSDTNTKNTPSTGPGRAANQGQGNGSVDRLSTVLSPDTHDLRLRFDHPTHAPTSQTAQTSSIDPRSHVPASSATSSPTSSGPNSAQDVCNRIHEHLIESQGANRVRRYFSASVSMNQLDHETIEITAGDRFTLDMIERRLGEPLRIAAQFALCTMSPVIRYRIDQAQAAKPTADAQKHPLTKSPTNTTQPSSNPLANRINPTSSQYPKARFPACPTLNEFLVGNSNRLALESVKQVIQAGADCPPVFIHGSCGVGKTHLLRGATHYARKLRPGCKVRYTTGEAFTNGFVNAIRTRSVDEFQKKFRGLDLLCIDDIHLMAGKQATQHELLQVFNKLSLGGCTIIFASDAHPRDIKRLDQALTSRFSAGLVVQVEEPDQELARRLITHIAGKRGVFLDVPAIQTILERVGIGRGASVRDLEGAIIQIQAVARLMDQTGSSTTSSTGSGDANPSSMRNTFGSRTPSMAHIRKALSLRDGSDTAISTGPIALESIIAKICEEMNVTKADLTGKGRQKKVVLARELIVHTARNLTTKSFPEIAYAIGRPNHSTVITAAKRFKGRVGDAQSIAVGCRHDGMPAGELAEMIANHIRN